MPSFYSFIIFNAQKIEASACIYTHFLHKLFVCMSVCVCTNQKNSTSFANNILIFFFYFEMFFVIFSLPFFRNQVFFFIMLNLLINMKIRQLFCDKTRNKNFQPSKMNGNCKLYWKKQRGTRPSYWMEWQWDRVHSNLCAILNIKILKKIL